MAANPSGSTSESLSSWRILYMAALFETDRAQLPGRITDAEKALVLRERELFAKTEYAQERQAVTNALHALRALRVCFGLEIPGGHRL